MATASRFGKQLKRAPMANFWVFTMSNSEAIKSGARACGPSGAQERGNRNLVFD